MKNQSQLFWHSLVTYPTILAASILGISGNAIAAENTQIGVETSTKVQIAQNLTDADPNTQRLEQIQRYTDESNNSLPQVTNVSQFSDVQSTDWAYEALSRVVEKYGCLQGYPDGTYRGRRALSRYEFAAGLNACLQQIEALIEAKGQNYVSKEDFNVLQRLVEEFRTELATLGGRVDNLEARTTFLEERQFSTTTKLTGEAIFAYTDSLDNKATPGIFGNRVYLGLNTSFTGQDLLYAELASGNIGNPIPSYYNINTFEGTQTFNLDANGNDTSLSALSYTFPLGKARVYISATGGIHSDYSETFNPYFEDFDGGNGALSTFASESSIYRIGGGAGAGITFDLNNIGISLGYLADNPTDPDPTNNGGLFNGGYAALAQLQFKLNDRFGLGLTYVRGNHNGDDNIFDEIVGTGQANNPFITQGVLTDNFTTNSYGLAANFTPSKKLSLSGFVSFTDANADSGGVDYEGEVWSYGVGLALPDLGKEGNVLGIYGGVSPTLRGFTANGAAQNIAGGRDNAYHVEAFYKYQLTDNISITPGVIWLSSPGQNSNNDDAIIGTVRTTFTF